ncbi:DNA-binding protein [Sulfurovum sp. bin170]|uniref:CvfB family protein n=1 Tax=Sulfurovum sp. bin170 TaxID=2695268 RepID=UPI0013DF5337|nr:S1-like domain-containing RNA-binding protein [Sulfurovum sp. bin170]NEW60783.1 DNA-binding protein [Sulfurovum sp. bin170]
MNRTIEIGKINYLRVERDTDYGLFLRAENFEEVLLPNAYVMEDEMPIGSVIEVFIYTDSEDRIVATTRYPYAMLGEFGYFTVVDYQQYGAFVNWGLPKDLFVPLSQQKCHFNIGNKFILRVCVDKETGRLYGTHKIGKWLSYETDGLEKNQKVAVLVLSKTPLGYKVIVENLYEGMLFDNEIFESLSVGDRKEAYIKNIRKDGKLDLALQPIGKKSTSDVYERKVLALLKDRGGFIALNSKSNAEDIMKVFALSKKSFKRTLTSLISDKKILLEGNGIRVLQEV